MSIDQHHDTTADQLPKQKVLTGEAPVKQVIEIEETSGNRRREFSTAQKVGAGVVGTLLTAGVIYGVSEVAGGGNSSPEDETTATSQPVETSQPEQTTEPSPSTDPTNIPNPEETTPVESVDIDSLIAIPPEQFATLPNPEQLALLAFRLDEIEGWDDIENNYGGYNPLRIANIDNTAEEIIRQRSYITQTATYQIDQSDLSSIRLDKDEARKVAMAAWYYNETDGYIDPAYQRQIDRINSADGLIDQTPQEGLEYSMTDLQSGKDRAGNPIQFRDITVNNTVEGEVFVDRMVYSTFTYNGREYGIWQTLQQIQPSRGEVFTEGI